MTCRHMHMHAGARELTDVAVDIIRKLLLTGFVLLIPEDQASARDMHACRSRDLTRVGSAHPRGPGERT